MPDQVYTEAAADLSATVTGVALVANQADAAITANANRDRLIISANVADVWLGYGQAAVVGKGHCVRSGGPPFEESAWKGSVSLISTGAAVVGWTETSYEAPGTDVMSGEPAFTPRGPSDTPIASPTGDLSGEADVAPLPTNE